MIEYGKTIESCHLTCDIPGCDKATVIESPMIAKLKENSGIAITFRAARAMAENRGWWQEMIRSRMRTLFRDVCPKCAPGYRTLLAMSKKGKENEGHD